MKNRRDPESPFTLSQFLSYTLQPWDGTSDSGGHHHIGDRRSPAQLARTRSRRQSQPRSSPPSRPTIPTRILKEKKQEAKTKPKDFFL